MSLTKKPDFMDRRVVTILQIMSDSREIFSSEDITMILKTRYGIDTNLLTVASIMHQLASIGLLVQYFPSGVPTSPESTLYFGPRIVMNDR